MRRFVLLASLAGCIGGGERARTEHVAADAAAKPKPSATALAPTKVVDAGSPVDRGAMLYGRYCDFCHGKEGKGYAADEAPALASDDLLTIASDEYLRDAILKGRPGTTMSAWGLGRGGPIGADDATALVAFLRTWQKKPLETLGEHKIDAGDAARGAKIWAKDCAKCHGAKGTGGKYNALANAELLTAASDAFLATTIERGRAGTPMPAFKDKLSKANVDDLLALLRSWQKAPDQKIELPPKPGELKNVVINPKGPDAKLPEGDFIPADTIKKEIDRGASLVIVDARAPGDYALMHVAGAVSVPFYTVNDYASQIPKDKWILTYCACPHAASVKARDAFRALGYKRVSVIDEGINVWRDRGYPVRGGAKP